MIVDFDQLEGTPEIECDICIVGTGACGTTLALELLNGRQKVVMIESGGERPEAPTTDLYQSEIAGLPHGGTHTGRARIFGGTTTLWGGQALPLFPLDFAERSWVSHSGWPISYSDLENYYSRAASVLQVPGAPYDVERSRRLPALHLDFAASGIEHVYSQWSPQPDFARSYRAVFARSTNIDVMLHANVVNIVANEETTAVTRMEVRSLSGRSGAIKAQYFALCAGGIETARLLLVSRDAVPEGLGNQNNLIGRYFQDHIAVKCGRVYPKSRRKLQQLFAQHHCGQVKFLPKLRATDELQRRRQILNVIANICFEWPENSSIELTKQTLRGFLRGQRPKLDLSGLSKSLRDLGLLRRIGWWQLVKKRSYLPGEGPIYLEVHCEQEPDPQSRVTLSSKTDALGMPRSRITWKPTSTSWKSILTFAQTLADEFGRLGLGRVELVLPPADDVTGWQGVISDMFHHMGTTRMHDDPNQGVVDRHCCVHGIRNLFIGSSAVFPTSGCSNPTLTAMALCARIAEHLKIKCSNK